MMKLSLKNNIAFQPVKVESYADLFGALAKALFHGFGKQFDEALLDLMDAGTALGIEETETRLAWKLINRSVIKAIADLVGKNRSVIPEAEEATFMTNIKKLTYNREIKVDYNFFDRPKESQFVDDIKKILLAWLKLAGVQEHQAQTITNRFPSFFIYAMHEEWGANTEIYKRLRAETPFTDAVIAEEDWERYRAYLNQQIQESIFDEAFSLEQIYVPLCGYFDLHREKDSEKGRERNNENGRKREAGFQDDYRKNTERHIIDLGTYFRTWIEKNDKDDAVRLISGGPGSGKSSFAKMFAASIAPTQDVLFIPLYRLDLSHDLEDVIGKFLVSNNVFKSNPLGKAESLLLIFDGLDEISQQGKASLEAAYNFVSQVLQLLNNYNHMKLQIRIIITGRELTVQANETYFKKDEQIIHVLPYYSPRADKELSLEQKELTCSDPEHWLEEDKREQWWSKYGDLTGKAYGGLPAELKSSIFDDITAQPLLNYLLALSYDWKSVNFTDETNINVLYDDLINAVYVRDWQRPSPGYKPLAGIKQKDYQRILEEIAVLTWQGDGRTTTVKAIAERCEKNQLKSMLERFENKAKDGVATLLMAFYFRDAGIQNDESTFEFTHKSFSEFLVAKRIVRQLETTQKAIENQRKSQTGWTHEDALENWLAICSNVAIDKYYFKFLQNEIRRKDINIVRKWQKMLCDLIGYMLRNGMPYDKITGLAFHEKTRQTRNSEEALLATLSACADYTKELSKIDWGSNTVAGEWLAKLLSQHEESNFAAQCLNYLDLSKCICRGLCLPYANLAHACLCEGNFSHTILVEANLSNADLNEALFYEADLRGANLTDVNLEIDIKTHYTLFYKARLDYIESKNSIIYYWSGYNYYIDDNYIKSIKELTKAIELEPSNAEYYFGRGASHHELKEYQKAIENQTKAIELEPSNAACYNERGISHHELKEYQKAVADKTKAIELEPDNAAYYNSRGTSYLGIKEFQKGIADKTKAIELEPNKAAYYNGRGICYGSVNEYQKAVKDLETAIEKDSKNPEYYVDLSFYLYKTGRIELAVTTLNKAFMLNEKLPLFYRCRAVINLKIAKKNNVNCDNQVLEDFNYSIKLAIEQEDARLYACYRSRAEYFLYVGEIDKAYDDVDMTWFYLAKYYEKKGDMQACERCMIKANAYGYIPEDDD